MLSLKIKMNSLPPLFLPNFPSKREGQEIVFQQNFQGFPHATYKPQLVGSAILCAPSHLSEIFTKKPILFVNNLKYIFQFFLQHPRQYPLYISTLPHQPPRWDILVSSWRRAAMEHYVEKWTCCFGPIRILHQRADYWNVVFVGRT